MTVLVWWLVAGALVTFGWCLRVWWEPRAVRMLRFDNDELERENQQLHAECQTLAKTNAGLRKLMNRSVPSEERSN